MTTSDVLHGPRGFNVVPARVVVQKPWAIGPAGAKPSDVIAVAFSLPWPPSMNTYWRVWNGRALLSRSGKTYRTTSALALAAQRVPRTRMAGSLAIYIEAYRPDDRRRDLDNLLKPVLDGLVHFGVVLDDFHFDRITIDRGPIVPGGRLAVTLTRMEG